MRYRVKAIQGMASPIHLDIDANSFDAARIEAEKAGYDVLTVRSSPTAGVLFPAGKRRIEIIEFSEESIALLNAGLTLLEAIEILGKRASDIAQRNALAHVAEQLKRGTRFSKALEGSGSVFPSLFVAAIRASEGTGTLTDALERYLAYERQLEQARSRITSASIYPLLLAAVGCFVMLFLLMFVVPRFSRLYKEVHVDLPWASRLLLDLGQFMDSHAVLVLGLLGCVAGGGIVWLRSEGSKRALVQLLNGVPGLRSRVRLFELSRLYRTLGLLLRSGVPLVSAVQISRDVVAESSAVALDRARVAIQEGQSVTGAFSAHGLTTDVAARMLAVAERTGSLSEMLERIAEFHERELSRWLERATRLFEPMLMTIIGLLIGVIVILMYMPIFDLAGNLG